MLTDMYQISMTYAHWLGGKADEYAVFDLFFRECPFGGEFAIFAGLDEILKLLSNFEFTDSDIAYLREILPNAEDSFFDWLATLGNVSEGDKL
jgi:nicotinate phosphoribosyltransferase